jgi:vacuolar-type H+-ATPase subunit I/STV1
MKKLYLIAIILILGIGTKAFAQRPPVDQEKLQAARIAFITTRLDLKPEQAEKFWPIFNQYNDQREKTMRQISELGRGLETVGEEEAKSRIQQRLKFQSELLEKEKTFVNDVSKVLSSKQILMLNNISRDFNRQLYQRGRGGN